MESCTERTRSKLGAWCGSLLKIEAIPGFSAYSLLGARRPLSHDTFVPEGPNLLFFASLMMLYLYLSYRLARYAVRFSGKVPPASFYNAAKLSDLAEKKIVTIYGKLKASAQNTSDNADSRFILEDAANNQIPIVPWFPLDGPSSAFVQAPGAMSNFLGKQLMVKGKVHLNKPKGEYAVVPELVMEVLPVAPR